jgi:hypothetical protein
MFKPTLGKLRWKLVALAALLGYLGVFSAGYGTAGEAAAECARNRCCCLDPGGGGIICQTVNGPCPECP